MILIGHLRRHSTLKLTKSSYQFLMSQKLDWNFIPFLLFGLFFYVFVKPTAKFLRWPIFAIRRFLGFCQTQHGLHYIKPQMFYKLFYFYNYTYLGTDKQPFCQHKCDPLVTFQNRKTDHNLRNELLGHYKRRCTFAVGMYYTHNQRFPLSFSHPSNNLINHKSSYF